MTIDVCKLYGPDTVFLQQAAHLTGGSYLYLEHKEALLQHLIVSCEKLGMYVNMLIYVHLQMTVLPLPQLRRFLATPEDKVDFRAAVSVTKTLSILGLYTVSV